MLVSLSLQNVSIGSSFHRYWLLGEGAGEVAQQVLTALAAKLHDLKSVIRTQTVEEENNLPQVIL